MGRATAVAACFLWACTGDIADSGPAVPPAPPIISGPSELPDDCVAETPPSPLRRLTSEELRNTLEDLLGEPVFEAVDAVVRRFPGESIGGGDLEGFQAVHVEPHVSAMLDIGEAVADAVLANAEAVDGAACIASGARTCARAFIETWAPRVHRRPVDAIRLDRYADAFASEADARDGFRLLWMMLLSNPEFLFHIELDGNEDGLVLQLDSYAVANRLSYRVLRTMPSAELFELAAADALQTDAELEAALDSLLAHPRARDSVWRFFEQWLELDEALAVSSDRTLLDGLDADGLEHALYEDVRGFVETLFWDQDADVERLFTSPLVASDDPRVRALYGLGPGAGRSGAERAGVLLRPALLQASTLATSPIGRGVFVLRRYLCDELPSPDLDTVNNRLSELEELDRSTMRSRDIIQAMTGDSPCSTCHGRINPIAFALEDFDPLGRHRSEEVAIEGGEIVGTFPFEPAGSQLSIDRETVTVDRGAELSRALGASRQVQHCFVDRLTVHTQGRVTGDADACDLSQRTSASLEGLSMHALFRSSVLAEIRGRALETQP
ncbi:MAG: DUF1592 domain-containing protein [Myxococcota bacterium]